MKTLFVLAVHISRFYSIVSILGYWQPSHAHDSVNKVSYDSISKKCDELDGDIRTSKFVDQDFLLCFGMKVFSQKFRNRTEASSVLDSVETLSNTEFCKHFEEMKLNLNNNKTADLYNRQFRDKNTCERACFDVMDNVNPLCSIILLLGRHSKGNPNVSGAQTPLTVLPVGKADDVDNEVSHVKTDSKPPRNMAELLFNSILNNQKPIASDAGVVINGQQQKISVKGQISDRLKLGLKSVENKSNPQKTENTVLDQISQRLKPVLPVEEAKLNEQIEMAGGTGVRPDKGKPKVASEEEAQIAESPKSIKLDEADTSRIQEQKDDISPDANTANSMLKKTANSKIEPTGITAEDTNLSMTNKNQDKPDTFTGKNTSVQSLVQLPKSSGDNKKEIAADIKTKPQETISVVENSLASKKVVADANVQGEESVSQVKNIEKGKEIISSPKLQADNRETENPPLKEAENPPLKEVEYQVKSETTIEKIPKSNTEEQKTNQNNEKAYTNKNAETVPQSGRDNAQKTASEEMQFTDTGDDLGEPETHVSVVADKNTINAETVVFREKYDDDDSHFFAYFMTTMVFCIVGYLVFHNKQKILALALEGRARRGRRRPNTSGYRKLDSNLEEAISSSKSASITQVIY